MTKYTVKVITMSGKVVYPKKLSMFCNQVDAFWTEDIKEAVWWEEYDCADTFAAEYECAEVITKD